MDRPAASQGAERPADRRVLMTGMFDMANFGDLLFPLVAAHWLERHGIEVVPVAPTARRAPFSDAPAPLAVDSLLDPEVRADGIVIGGGYLVHNHPLRYIESYDPGPTGDFAASALWIGAAVAAARRGIPIAWNAPGVPHPIRAPWRPLADAMLRASDYVALRDQGSAALLAAPDDVAVAIVPDTIASLPQLFPRRSLDAPYRAFRDRLGLTGERPYIALHFRHRSLAGLDRRAIAAAFSDFAAARGLAVVLPALGQSHDDAGLAREMAGYFPTPPILYDAPASLQETTAVLAHAALYVGASLHGYVAATAYGVPGVLVGRPAYRKFDGYLHHVGRIDDLARDWDEALGRAAAPPGSSGTPETVTAAVAAHFDRIADTVRAGPVRLSARRALLAAAAFADPALWPRSFGAGSALSGAGRPAGAVAAAPL